MSDLQRRADRTSHGRRHAQRGLSMPGVLAIVAAALFIGTFAIKVGPAYLENMTINKIVSDKAADTELMRSPRSKVYSAIDRAYDMNNLHGMKAEDTIELKKHADQGYVMTVKYEKRANLFSNIDVVTRFEREAAH